MRRGLAFVVGLSVLSLAVALPARATGPGIHERFDSTYDTEVCAAAGQGSGIPVRLHDEGLVNSWYLGGDGYRLTVSETITLTNLANGHWVRHSIRGQQTYREIWGSDTGLEIYRWTGVPEKLEAWDGTRLADRGLLTLVFAWDLSAGTLVSHRFEAGPHPIADSDMALRCRFLSAALT